MQQFQQEGVRVPFPTWLYSPSIWTPSREHHNFQTVSSPSLIQNSEFNRGLILPQNTFECSHILSRVLLLLKENAKVYIKKIRQKIGVQDFNLYAELINNLQHIKIFRKVNFYHTYKDKNYNYLSFMGEETKTYLSLYVSHRKKFICHK